MGKPSCVSNALFFSLVTALSSAVFLAGCGKPAGDSAKAAGKADASPAAESASAQPAPVVPGPAKGEKVCFGCSGEGMVACRAAGCREGKVECPGGCLRLTRGTWIHMTVAGHGPNELWKKFPNASGKGGYNAWNQNHVGDVIVMQNGEAVNIGRCKVCGGTTKVDCPVCKGQGKQTCEICGGKKYVPDGWTATDNPWLNSQPDLLRLKDGRVLLGKAVLSIGDEQSIRLRDGKIVHVKADEIVTKGQ